MTAALIAAVTTAVIAESSIAKGGEMLRADGYVYCHTHGGVHDDTTDPYNYGEADCDEKDHRPVYFRARKGDWK